MIHDLTWAPYARLIDCWGGRYFNLKEHHHAGWLASTAASGIFKIFGDNVIQPILQVYPEI